LNTDVRLDAAAATVEMIAGGIVTGDVIDGSFSGSTSVTLSAGSVSYGVAGRCVVYEGTLTDTAGTADTNTISITGGYSRIAVGAGMVRDPGAYYSYTGDTKIVITGGTVDYVFGGNAAQKKAYCGNTAMYGDASISVDTSKNDVSLQYVFGGSNSNSNSRATQEGNTTITFTGDGSRLHWAAVGGLSGDGAAQYSDIDNTRFTRSLVFDGFSGNFDVPAVSRFDSVSFLNASDVTFTSTVLTLSAVSAWEFSRGTSLDWGTGTNSFAGDTLVLGALGDSLAAGETWDVISSNSGNIFNGWGNLGSIEVFGDALDTYDAATRTWSSAGSDYLAAWDNTRNCIYIALA
jgi:hypothetical protein